jgi:hypothetical protein
MEMPVLVTRRWRLAKRREPWIAGDYVGFSVRYQRRAAAIGPFTGNSFEQ